MAKIRRGRKILKNLGLIEDVSKQNEVGTIVSHYVKVNEINIKGLRYPSLHGNRDPLYGFVYFLKCGELHKIGITKYEDKRRLRAYESSCPFPIELLFFNKMYDYLQVENEIKDIFQHKTYKSNEWFTLDETDVDSILEYLHIKLKRTKIRMSENE